MVEGTFHLYIFFSIILFKFHLGLQYLEKNSNTVLKLSWDLGMGGKEIHGSHYH